MWIGLLFAIMSVATLYEQFSPNEAAALFHRESTPDPRHFISAYREKVVQCLILANYTKSSPYTIETLILYLHAEYVRSEDTQAECWVLLGIVIQLALRMGYHMDGSQFPRISLFNAEIRRRIWLVIFMLDVFTSAQVGLPRMLKDSQYDTTEPRNLLDDDLYEGMAELPGGRPDTVQTPVQFFVTKSRIVSVFGRISDLTTSTPPCSYNEIMTLDSTLHAAYNAIPEWLGMHSMDDSVMDTPELVMRRVYIALLFHTARCVLHRKYLIHAKTDATFTYSHTTCIEAALQILHIQREVDQEMQIGGRLYQNRWNVSSVVKNEFLLATTILCLDLDQGLDKSCSLASESSSDIEARECVVKALNESYFIWLRSSEASREARKAVEVLRTVLGKAHKLGSGSSQSVEGKTPGEIDESLLQRPQPFNYMPASRRPRGPMVLPQMDEDRWGDGDLATALEMNEEPEVAVSESCDYDYGIGLTRRRTLGSRGIRGQAGEIFLGCRRTPSKNLLSPWVALERSQITEILVP